jgi:hypothetical protein
VFLAAPASDQTTYTDELWGATLTRFIDQARARFDSLPLLVTLNAGAMPDDPPRLQDMGDYAVGAGLMVGQNGLRGSSYSTAQASERWHTWRQQTPTFFEMVAGTGTETGTMQEVADAAVRVQASFLNVYASDVLRATPGSATYDASSESALAGLADSLAAAP